MDMAWSGPGRFKGGARECPPLGGLRAEPWRKGAFSIALTGYALPDEQRRAINTGFDLHLSKPATMEQLRRGIAQAP